MLFAVAGGDYGSAGDLSLWTLDSPHEIGFVSFGEFPLDAVSFSPDDKVLAAASNDGFGLLYAVDRIRGPQVKKQDYALCGEVVKQEKKTFIVPLSKVVVPLRPELELPWKLESVNSNAVAEVNSVPVVVSDWSIESSSDTDRASIRQSRLLLQSRAERNLDHILFGVVQNPGWDEGFVVKIYEDGSFVAAMQEHSRSLLRSDRLFSNRHHRPNC